MRLVDGVRCYGAAVTSDGTGLTQACCTGFRNDRQLHAECTNDQGRGCCDTWEFLVVCFMANSFWTRG